MRPQMIKLSMANGYYTPNVVSLHIRFAAAITHLALMYINAFAPSRIKNAVLLGMSMTD